MPPPNVSLLNLSTARPADIEQLLTYAVETNNTLHRDQIVQSWVARLRLPPSSPHRLSPVRGILFGDHYGLNGLLGPACLAYILETPLVSDALPTSTVVSTVRHETDRSLKDRHRVRLLLGYYAMQTAWMKLRTSPHRADSCSENCLASWLHRWSAADSAFPDQGNVLKRIHKIREELVKESAPLSMEDNMTTSCWRAAFAELVTASDEIQAGHPFLTC